MPHPAALPELASSHIAALTEPSTSSALEISLLVLITCPPILRTSTAQCLTADLAKEAALDMAGRYAGILNVTHAEADALPLTSLGIAPERDLPALLLVAQTRGFGGSLRLLPSGSTSGPPGRSRAPVSTAEWIARMEALAATRGKPMWEAAGTEDVVEFRAVVRSGPPSLPGAAWAQRSPVVSTARTLEADLAAAEHCGLLLIHDARLDALTDAAAATPSRWKALGQHLDTRFAEQHPFAKSSGRLLSLDLATNALPETPLGASLSASLAATGLPAFVRVSPSHMPNKPASFATVPARRMRATTALLNWAISHAQSCERAANGRTAAAPATPAGMERVDDTGMAPADAVPPDAVPSAASRAWLRSFVQEGVPTLEASLHAELRRHAAARVHRRAAELAVSHEARNDFRVAVSRRRSKVGCLRCTPCLPTACDGSGRRMSACKQPTS